MDVDQNNTGVLLTPEGSGLSDIFGAIVRRKWVLIQTVAAFLILGFVGLLFVAPRYTAEGMVLIESQESNIASLEAVVAGLPGDAASVQSEAYILNSRNLARRVIARLGLLEDAEFNGYLADVGSYEDFLSLAKTEGERLEREKYAYQTTTDSLLSRLTVSPQDNSRVIAVSFVSNDPAKAQLVTNTLLDEYMVSRIEAKYDSTRQANSWLTERIAELREKVELAEGEVENLRREYGLLADNGLTLSSQELSEINAQLIVTRSARSNAEAQLNQLKTLVEQPGGIDTASEVLNSPLIQRLREQQAVIQTDIAELSSEYGAKHPRMISLQAEAKDLENKITDEVYKTIGGLENEVKVSRAKERALEQNVDRLKTDVANANQNSIKVRMIEREAEASRALLATLLALQKETLSQEDFDFQQADARVISYADIPAEPSFPNKVAILALLFIASTCIGLFLILLLELLDHGVRSGEDLAAVTGVPSLGFAPVSAAMKQEESLPAFAEKRNSAYGQAIKTLDWSIKLGFPDDKPPQIIMFTSSVPLEGKSTVASCLAYNQAITGSKVLLIDADMRRPSIYKKAGLNRGAGLADLLRGPGLAGVLQDNATLDDAVVRYRDTSLYIVPAGRENNYDSEGMIGSAAMDELLRQAASEYDMVIIDTPPVMACADSRILASRVDATVFVIRWNETKMAVVKMAMEQLASAGARFAGTFLSMVNLKHYATYQYGDVVAYGGDMEKYYASSPEESQDKAARLRLVPQASIGD
jgi:capsular exopolysaccharide synthesis family protein